MKRASTPRTRKAASVRQSVTIPAQLAVEEFIAEPDPELKNEAGKDLIRAVFGKDAIAEDPVL